MKKLLVFFCCMFVLLIFSTQKTFAQEGNIRGLHGGSLFIKSLAAITIKQGEDLKFIVFEQDPVAEVYIPGHPLSPMPIEVNGIEFNSVGDPVEYNDNPDNAPKKETHTFIDYIFVIPANELPNIGIERPGEYKLTIQFRKGTIGELEVIVKEETAENPKDNDKSDDSTSILDFENVEFLLKDLTDLQEDFLAEAKDSRNRTLRSIGKKISKIMRLIERALENAEDGDPDSCNDDFEDALGLFDFLIEKLKSKSCEVRESRRCIPANVVVDFSFELEDILGELDSELPDVCGN